MKKTIGMLLLAIYLIVVGLATLIPALNVYAVSVVEAILALAAGALILIGK